MAAAHSSEPNKGAPRGAIHLSMSCNEDRCGHRQERRSIAGEARAQMKDDAPIHAPFDHAVLSCGRVPEMRPEQFDLVIIDEASESGLEALFFSGSASKHS